MNIDFLLWNWISGVVFEATSIVEMVERLPNQRINLDILEEEDLESHYMKKIELDWTTLFPKREQTYI